MDNAATMRRMYDLINAGDVYGFGDLLADDFVDHEELPGLAPTTDGVTTFFRMYLAAFPDLTMTLEDVLPSGDKVERAHEVECVYIPETDRGTLCVSSQVGCTLNCSFCHTGTQRLVRNLTAGEIVGQVMVARSSDSRSRARW